MEQEKKQAVALMRYSAIAPLIAGDLRIGFAGDVAIAFLDF